MKVFNFLDKTSTHWQWFKDFFQITIFRYLITWFAIVPLFAGILDSIPHTIKIGTSLDFSFNLHLSLPFNWKLLWLSSFFFVIAFAIYKIFCPRFITLYSSYTDYKKHLHSPRWIVWEAVGVVKDKKELKKLFERLNTKGYLKKNSNEKITTKKIKPEVQGSQTILRFNFENETYSLEMPRVDDTGNYLEPETEVAEKEIFWEVFGRYASSKRIWRFFIIFFLLLSLVLFLMVFVQNIWSGLVFMFK